MPPKATKFGFATAGRNGPSGGSGASGNGGSNWRKRSAAESSQSDRNKQKRVNKKLDKLRKEMGKWQDDNAFEIAHGGDRPSGNVWQKAMKQADLIPITFAKKTGLSTHAKSHGAWRLARDCDSNAPALVIIKDDWEVVILGQNIQPFNDNDKTDIFRRIDLDAKMMTDKDIKDAGEKTIGYDLLDDTDVTKLKTFGTIEQSPKDSGLQVLTFTAKNTILKRWIGKGEPKPDEDVNSFVEQYRQGTMVSLFRKLQVVAAYCDAFWLHRMRVSMNRGLMWFFTHLVDGALQYSFDKWIEDPNRALKHHPWMKFADSDEYASHSAKIHFKDIKEWEVIISSSLIHEIAHENLCISKYFTYGIAHEAEVILKRGRYIQMAVTVTKNAPWVCPQVVDRSEFGLKLGGLIEPVEDEEMDDATPPTDAGMESARSSDPSADAATAADAALPAPAATSPPSSTLNDAEEDDDAMETESNPESETEEELQPEINFMPTFKARAIEKETKKSFVLSLFVSRQDASKFRQGSTYIVHLEMAPNRLPSTRMLEAIKMLSHTDKDSAIHHHVRQFLLGDDITIPQNTKSILENKTEMLQDNPELQALVAGYVEGLKCNGPQQDAMESIFGSQQFVNTIQGPPGTGKTKTDVGIAVLMALLGIRTAATAPTNQAAEALMNGVVDDFENIFTKMSSLRGKVKAILFPTASTLREQLQEPRDIDAQADVAANDDEENRRRDKVRPYMLWHRIEGEVERLSRESGDIQELQESRDWLATLEAIRDGETIKGTGGVKKFLKYGAKIAKKVITDPSVMLVVATSSNSALLREYGYCPEALLIDECAFAMEADSAIPLTLNAKFIVLSGDHEQLKPMNRAKNYNEYFNQQGMSMFERVLKNHNVPLFRLKINYRMHPDIALLPGMISYGWLGCDKSTSVERHEFKFVNDFWNSASNIFGGKKYRRGPKYGGQQSSSIRRLFFNIKGATSAPVDGTTSLVNFDNAQAIVLQVLHVLGHQPKNLPTLDPSKITIVTGDSQQKAVIKQLLKVSFLAKRWPLERIPKVVTIESIQGGQNEIIFLDITAANEWHGSLVGFLSTWNRMNVALTRAKQILWIFGNIDCWLSELKVIVENLKGKKFSLFLIDLLDRGDIIDIELGTPGKLPATKEEVFRPDQWSLEMPKSLREDCQLAEKTEIIANAYKQSSAAEKLAYEKSLLKELQTYRTNWIKLQAAFKKHGENGLETDLFFKIKGDGKDEAMDEMATLL